MRKPRLLFQAEPFCYGPSGTLSSIVEAIGSRAAVQVVATGSSSELLARKRGIRLLPLDTSNPAHGEAIGRALREADLAVNVLGGKLVKAARRMGIPSAYVDVLFWAWPGAIDPEIAAADAYFVENTFEAPALLSSGRYEIANPVLVPPISVGGRRHDPAAAEHVLVTFGGMFSKLTPSTRYHLAVAAALLDVLGQDALRERVVFAGAESAMREIGRLRRPPWVEARSFPHDEFLDVLGRSRLLVAQPGLTTTLEAFFAGVPTAFLPPMNYSQHLQLRRLAALGCADHALAWPELLGGEGELPDDLPEAEGVARIAAMTERLREPGPGGRLRAWLREVLALSDSQLQRLRARQGAMLQATGTDGADVVARTLLELCS